MNSKYLKYAFGEIILVVIGILIALSINNWSERQKARKELHDNLIEIYNDFNKDLLTLQDRTEYYESFIDNIHYLRDNHSEIDSNTLSDRFSRLHRATEFTSVQFGYKKLNNNPNTSLLPAQLINKITEYYTQFGPNSFNNTNPDQLSTYSLNLLRDFLIPFGFPLFGEFRKEMKPADARMLREITKSDEFWGILRNMEFNWGIQQFGIEEAKLKIESILELLISYFEKNNIAYKI